jgi:murein DD-endopeptidase MepM/ murein hydrolase activator NlpD
MKKTAATTILLGALFAGCATPTPVPTANPTQAELVPSPTCVRSTEAVSATPTGTPTLTPTHTPQPTNTPTPRPTYTLSGTVFFDYNGNGLRDEGEPPIEGIPIRVDGLSTSSGPDGKYLIAGVPAGSQHVYVESPTQDPATAFRYISLSLEAFQPIEEPLAVAVNGNTSLHIALMHGFLTLPFACATEYPIYSWFDLDPTRSLVRAWNGDTTLTTMDLAAGLVYPGTFDEHMGLDFNSPIGTSVVATAPGTVRSAGPVPSTHPCPGALNVYVEHPEGFGTSYGHLASIDVTVGQHVARGSPIGASGCSGSCCEWPHLHWGFYVHDADADAFRDAVRPPTARSSAVSYWTVDNSPQCVP